MRQDTRDRRRRQETGTLSKKVMGEAGDKGQELRQEFRQET